MYPGKMVLVSGRGYCADRDSELLSALIASKVELFCVVGLQAHEWEDAMDWLCIGANGEGLHTMVTTSHQGEPVEEVIAFAEYFHTVVPHAVEVIYV